MYVCMCVSEGINTAIFVSSGTKVGSDLCAMGLCVCVCVYFVMIVCMYVCQ